MEESEKKQKEDEFVKDLIALCYQHNIKNVSITGQMEEKYLGMVFVDAEKNMTGFFESVLNVGRLWQYTRERVQIILNDFEK